MSGQTVTSQPGSRGAGPRKRKPGAQSPMIVAILLTLVVTILLWGNELVSVVYNNLGSIEPDRALISSTRRRASGADPLIPNYAALDSMLRAPNYFEHAITWDVGNANTYRNLGCLYIVERDRLAAAEALPEWASFYPDSTLTHFELANAYHLVRQPVDAVSEYEQGLHVLCANVNFDSTLVPEVYPEGSIKDVCLSERFGQSRVPPSVPDDPTLATSIWAETVVSGSWVQPYSRMIFELAPFVIS